MRALPSPYCISHTQGQNLIALRAAPRLTLVARLHVLVDSQAVLVLCFASLLGRVAIISALAPAVNLVAAGFPPLAASVGGRTSTIVIGTFVVLASAPPRLIVAALDICINAVLILLLAGISTDIGTLVPCEGLAAAAIRVIVELEGVGLPVLLVVVAANNGQRHSGHVLSRSISPVSIGRLFANIGWGRSTMRGGARPGHTGGHCRRGRAGVDSGADRRRCPVGA